MKRTRRRFLVGCAAVVFIPASMGPTASEPSEATIHAADDLALRCAPGDIETSTVITYAAGARGQQDPTRSLHEFIDRSYPASSDTFYEATDAELPTLATDGAFGPIAVAYIESDGVGGWRVQKFNACHKEFEQDRMTPKRSR